MVQRPITGINFGGIGPSLLEPALTSANIVKQTILNPPFVWQWNRLSFQFNTVIGQSDYSVFIPNYGYVESYTTFDATAVAPNPATFQGKINLSVQAGSDPGRPDELCPLQDDNAGNITFRLSAVPDKVYVITILYQAAPSLITSLNQTWAPIPDKFQFLYSRGFKGMLHGIYDSSLYQMELSLFLRQLIGVSEGLTETQKAIFLEDSLLKMKTTAAMQGKNA